MVDTAQSLRGGVDRPPNGRLPGAVRYTLACMTDRTTPEALVDEFVRRICAFDLDAACELVTDDIEYDNVPIGKSFGPDGIKAVLAPLMGGVEEVEWIVHRQVARGDIVLNERSDRFRVGERWIELPVAGVFEVTDGKISLWRDYFDAAAVHDLIAALA